VYLPLLRLFFPRTSIGPDSTTKFLCQAACFPIFSYGRSEAQEEQREEPRHFALQSSLQWREKDTEIRGESLNGGVGSVKTGQAPKMLKF
jgi:hypothetical protein